MRTRTFAATLALSACSSGYFVDQAEVCRRAPDDLECPTPAGSAGNPGMGAGGAGPAGASGAAGSGGAGFSGGGTGGGQGGSGGLACGAPEVDCDGVCVDVKASDADHCGACGRSCRGSTCEAGACTPEAMTAAGEVAPYALADDGTYLYWVSPASKAGSSVSDARLRRVAKVSARGAAQNVFDGVRVRARSLGFAGGKLFWGDLGASPSDVASQRLVAGTPGTGDCCTTVAPGQAGIEHLTVGGGKVYWSLLSLGAVRGKAADGSGDIAPEVFAQTNPRWVVVDADAVPYWVAVDAAGTGREVRRTVSPSAAEPVAAGPDVVAVELTAERFYWADRAAGTVQSRPKATPTEAPREEFSGQGA
ncbi:MAG TPA: hypothetical protein VFS00_01505, partial [Polyangiaceae bacterium]|nr:hypothetical protein [Polyangiaceae bacterium]